MSAVTAIKTDLRRELLRILKEDINYKVQENDGGDIIEPTAIMYQKTRLQKSRSFEQSNQNVDYPGLILCDPKRGATREDGGTNERDLWVYDFMIQLVDKDMWDDELRSATWDKWAEQIVSAIQYSQMNSAVTLPKGQIWWAAATEVSHIDETSWVRDAQFINGIEVNIKVLQPRGIIA